MKVTFPTFFASLLVSLGCSIASVSANLEVVHDLAERLPLPSKLSDATAVNVNDEIYIFGGCDSESQPHAYIGFDVWDCTSVTSQALKYEPDTDTYFTLPELPTPRYRHAAAVVGDSVYLFGGLNIGAAGDEPVYTVDVFNTITLVWTTVGTNWDQSASDLTGFALGTNIYAASGWSVPDNYRAISDVYVMDTTAAPGLLKFEKLDNGLSLARGDLGSTVVNGVAYVFGGYDQDFKATAVLERFDANSLEFKVKAFSSSTARGDKSMEAIAGRIFVFGGEVHDYEKGSWQIPLTDIEMYTPIGIGALEGWVEVGHLNAHRFRFASAVVGNSVYFFGGQIPIRGVKYDPSINYTESYLPVTDSVERFNLVGFPDAKLDTDPELDTDPSSVAIVGLVLACCSLAGVIFLVLKGNNKEEGSNNEGFAMGEIHEEPKSIAQV